MQIYDIAIAPGVPRQIDADGDYFYFYSGNAGGADASILLQCRANGLRIELMPGQSYKLPPGTSESSWILTNRVGGGTIIGKVVIGRGGLQDNRITGSVEVIDGGKNRTLAGQAFGASCLRLAAAGNYHRIQLWNPAASGKRLFVEQVVAGASPATGVFMVSSTAALANVVQPPVCKLLGGGPGVAELRAFADNTGPNAGQILGLTLNTAQSFSFKLSEPICVLPGYGLVLWCATANTDLNASFEYFEETI